MREGIIYLLHFEEPFRHAKHYLGWTHPHNLESRLWDHYHGQGSRLMEVLRAHNIDWRLAALWEGTRSDERRIKLTGGKSRICPLCTAQPANMRFVTPLTIPKTVAQFAQNMQKCDTRPVLPV